MTYVLRLNVQECNVKHSSGVKVKNKINKFWLVDLQLIINSTHFTINNMKYLI